MVTESQEMPLKYLEDIDERNQSAQSDKSTAQNSNNDGTVCEGVTKEYPESIYSHSWEQWFFIVLIGIASFMSTVSIPIYFPIIDELSQSFGVSVTQINVTATIYSIFQGISPAYWAPISDAWGRRPVYMCCTLIYIAANISLAEARNYGTLLGLRILQAFGGASTISLLGGVVGDLSTKTTRGQLMGMAFGLSQLGNCFGPLAGSGIETQFESWRSIFWALAVFGGIMLVSLFFLLPETNRRVVGNGSRASKGFRFLISRSPYSWVRHSVKGLPKYPREEGYDQEWVLPHQKIQWFKFFNLFAEFRVIMLLIPTALHYTTWYMVLTAQSTLLATPPYNFPVRNIGFTYLSSGIGSFLSTITTGKIMQYSYRRQARYSPINIYKARLEFAMYASVLEIMTTIVFGWCLHFKVSFYAPVVMTFFISAGAAFFLSTSSALLVDMFPGDAAASQSCNNMARCLLCAAGLAALQEMMNHMTIGGTFTFMAGLCMLSNLCIIFVLVRYGTKKADQTLVRTKSRPDVIEGASALDYTNSSH